MRIAIRTDSSCQIGTGHVTRCLALADGFRARGVEVRFLCREFPGDLREAIHRAGYCVDTLPESDSEPDVAPNHATWLGCAWDHDALQTFNVLKDWKADWLIVDHYGLDARWEGMLRGVVGRIFVIDDLADRRHDCDLLLDQNSLPAREVDYQQLVPSSCSLLLGPRYALLRPEYGEFAKRRSSHSGEVKRLHVFMGGADTTGETLKALMALERVIKSAIQVDVVIGAANTQAGLIRDRCEARGWNVYEAIPHLAELLSNADLAIGAGGSAQLERCALGVPSIVLGLAENQRPIVVEMTRAGCALGFPDASVVNEELLAAAVKTLVGNPCLLKSLSEAAAAMVDGQGLRRVLDRMLAPGLELRSATLRDAKDLWNWRNNQAVRMASSDSAEIPWDSHLAWLGRTLQSATHRLLIAELEGLAVGVIRFDLNAPGGQASVSVYRVPGVAPELRGLGGALLRSGAEWLRSNQPKVTGLRATVLADNDVSRRMFADAGFVPVAIEYLKQLDDHHEQAH